MLYGSRTGLKAAVVADRIHATTPRDAKNMRVDVMSADNFHIQDTILLQTPHSNTCIFTLQNA